MEPIQDIKANPSVAPLPHDSDASRAPVPKEFPCQQCGAKLKFKPGTSVLICGHCGHETSIVQSESDIEELNYGEVLTRYAEQQETEEHTTVQCSTCSAQIESGPQVTATTCPYCGGAIVTTEQSTRVIKPASLLPFSINAKDARRRFKTWIAGLWFAPSELKTMARMDNRLAGMYVPYWTYDSDTTSIYRGQRGDDYWVTENYTTTENGKTVNRTRQVRRTRWHMVSGTVNVSFDDVLVMASHSLPTKFADALEPWDLENLMPYDAGYLSGFRAESYQVDLVQGFEHAKLKMDHRIRVHIKSDIGGDHQRIDSVRTTYDGITFKHILLPVWICAYRYRKKIYRFLVNARTGEVQGERPWSWVKITAATLAVATVVAAILWFSQGPEVHSL